MRMGRPTLLALATLLACAGTAAAQQAKCLAGKTKCITTLATAAHKCHATARTPGKTADPNAGGCLDKAAAKFDGGTAPDKGCFAKLEARTTNDCLTTDDAGAVQAAVGACVDQAVAAVDPAPLDQSTCGAKKQKCVGALVAGLLKCHRLAWTPGKSPDPNAKACLDKVAARYDGGADPAKGCFAKLEAKSANDCLPPIGNAAAVAALVDACWAAIRADLTASPATTTTTTVATTTTTTTISPLCGNGAVDAGESCDDGNTSDNDPCPADCVIDACTFGTAVDRDVTVRFDPPAGGSIAGIAVLVDYPEGAVHINGSLTTIPAGTLAGTVPGAINSFVELNHALRAVVARTAALPPGQLFTVKFKACTGAPAPVAADFPCQVLDASDPFANPVSGATCSVTIP